MSDDIPDRVDDLEGRVDALNRARIYLQDRVEDLETENAQLRDRLADLEEIVDPDPASRDYTELSREQKVHRVRRALVEQAATQQTGKTSMAYDDVQWLFDGHPSPGHAYDLMELAGNLAGFEHVDPDDRQQQIRVDLDAVNDETLIRAANNASAGGVV